MDASPLNQSKSSKYETRKSHLADAASQLLTEGKKFANELYEEKAQQISDAQDSIQENLRGYSNDVTQKVHQNPLSSLLIAAGVGFLLSAILLRG